MRSVTRTMLTLGTVVLCVGAAGAQTPGDVRPAVLIRELRTSISGSSRSPAAVIERLMSFDSNKDDRISRDELPERMQELVSRGDANVDGALDSSEIRVLVTAASSRSFQVSFRTDSSEGLAGVIKDLKLSPAKQDRAFAVVRGYTLAPNIHDPAGSGFYQAMRELLDDQEYENFVAASERLKRSPQVGGGTIGGVVSGVIQ